MAPHFYTSAGDHPSEYRPQSLKACQASPFLLLACRSSLERSQDLSIAPVGFQELTRLPTALRNSRELEANPTQILVFLVC